MKKVAAFFVILSTAYASRTDPEGMQLLARSFWRILLSLGMMTVVASIALGVFRLAEVLSAVSTVPENSAVQPITLSRAQLESALSALEMRREKFQALSAGTSTANQPR